MCSKRRGYDFSLNRFDVIGRLGDLMEAKKVSMYKITKETGIHPNTIRSWFSKEVLPSIDKLELCCKVLGITLSEFFNFPETVTESDDIEYLWSMLSDKQRNVVLAIIKELLNRNS